MSIYGTQIFFDYCGGLSSCFLRPIDIEAKVLKMNITSTWLDRSLREDEAPGEPVRSDENLSKHAGG